jgi:hypothetical protein
MKTANEKRYASTVKGFQLCFFQVPYLINSLVEENRNQENNNEFVIRGFSELLSE